MLIPVENIFVMAIHTTLSLDSINFLTNSLSSTSTLPLIKYIFLVLIISDSVCSSSSPCLILSTSISIFLSTFAANLVITSLR
jgi:hypothetical protein